MIHNNFTNVYCLFSNLWQTSTGMYLCHIYQLDNTHLHPNYKGGNRECVLEKRHSKLEFVIKWNCKGILKMHGNPKNAWESPLFFKKNIFFNFFSYLLKIHGNPENALESRKCMGIPTIFWNGLTLLIKLI